MSCPGGHTVAFGATQADGSRAARFGPRCASCPLQASCTTSFRGRTLNVDPHEDLLTQARQRQQDPAWQHDYRANRPKVERCLAHLLRRQHGGRNARMRGLARVAQDWEWAAAARNIARLATRWA